MRKFLWVLLVISDLACAQTVMSQMPTSRQILREGGLADSLTEGVHRAAEVAAGAGDNRSGAAAQGAPTAGALTTFVPVGKTGALDKVAAAYPEANRVEVRRVLGELLVSYAMIEQQFDLPSHDLAGSVAAFLAGSYMAYRDVDFPDENFVPLVRQMRQVIGSNLVFQRASNSEKQEMYEQMASVGMLMASTQLVLKQSPNPQAAVNVKLAAKGYLEQFLKTDANRVEITANGLAIR